MLRGLGKDVLVYGASDFFFRLIGFAVFPIYAHVFSIRDFGVIELVTVSSGLIALVCMLGLNNSVQRFYWDPEIPAQRQPMIVSTGLWLQVCASFAIVTIVLAGLYPFRRELESQYAIEWPVVLLAVGGIVPALALQFSLDVLRLHLAPWRFVAVSFLRNVFGTALGLLLILVFGLGVLGVFAGSTVAALVALPLAFILIRRDLRLEFESQMARTLIHFGYPFVFMGMAYWIFGSLDRWMLAELSDMENVGLYGIAFKFATIVMFVNIAFGQAWSPWAMKIRTERADYRKVYSQVLTLWFLGLTLVSAVLSLFARELLVLTTPEPYWAAANILVIGVVGVVFSGTSQVTAVGISIERRSHLFASISWMAAVTNFGLNLLLIPKLGALGAAASTTLTYIGLSLAYLYWTQKLHPLPLDWRRLISVFVMSLLIIPTAWVLNSYQSGVLTTLIKALIPVCIAAIAWRCGFFAALTSERRTLRPAGEISTRGRP